MPEADKLTTTVKTPDGDEYVFTFGPSEEWEGYLKSHGRNALRVATGFAPESPAGTRGFGTGAVRDSEAGKFDYEGFLSPRVVHAFAAYMDGHRHLPDGSLRGSDNWQNGMPLDVYMKSAFRHFMDWWTLHRGLPMVRPENGEEVLMQDALCGLLFNVQGYLHEALKEGEQQAEPLREGYVEVPESFVEQVRNVRFEADDAWWKAKLDSDVEALAEEVATGLNKALEEAGL